MLTPTNFGTLTDVMAALPTGSGLSVGMVQQIPNSEDTAVLVLNDSGGTLAIGAALKLLDPTETYAVGPSTNLGEVAQYFNSISGQTVPDGYYFWAGRKGYHSILVADGTAAGDLVVPTAVDGVLGTFDVTSPPQQQSNIQCLAANSSGGAAARLCLVS